MKKLKNIKKNSSIECMSLITYNHHNQQQQQQHTMNTMTTINTQPTQQQHQQQQQQQQQQTTTTTTTTELWFVSSTTLKVCLYSMLANDTSDVSTLTFS